MVIHAYNPGTQEVEAGGSQVWGQSGISFCLEKEKKKRLICVWADLGSYLAASRTNYGSYFHIHIKFKQYIILPNGCPNDILWL
jgi:hypothetical protein